MQSALTSPQGLALVSFAFLTPEEDGPRVGDVYTLCVTKKVF